MLSIGETELRLQSRLLETFGALGSMVFEPSLRLKSQPI